MQRRLTEFVFNGITKRLLMVDEFLSHPYPYSQGLVKIVRDNGTFDAHSIMDTIEHNDKPIKIEGYEKMNAVFHEECRRLAAHFDHHGPVTCHLFISPEDSSSFPMHTDLDDVVVHMVKGQKTFEFPTGSLKLCEGQSIYIPKGTPHRAINTHDSLMLSFGLELFHVEKL